MAEELLEEKVPTTLADVEAMRAMILRGEMPSKEKLRAGLAVLRQDRVASKPKGKKGKVPVEIDMDSLLG